MGHGECWFCIKQGSTWALSPLLLEVRNQSLDAFHCIPVQPMQLVGGMLVSELHFVAVPCADVYRVVVGASGGVYCILGIHSANLVLNWNIMNKSVFNHWARLLILSLLMSLDWYSWYLEGASSSCSYSAHMGGWGTGLCLGFMFLRSFGVQAKCERYVQINTLCIA